MQQTGLNIIAISVFTITISILLGPLFNISPLIPAGTTVIIMGLITFDTFTLENKGVKLLLDFFASSEEKERIIYHEAGHFFVAYILGIPINAYSLSVWESLKQGNKGKIGVIFATENLPEKDNLPLILERLATVLMAGSAAEKMVFNKVKGGIDDRLLLRQFLESSGLTNPFFKQKENWAMLQAKNILERHKSAFELLVSALKDRKTIEECYDIIHHNITLSD